MHLAALNPRSIASRFKPNPPPGMPAPEPTIAKIERQLTELTERTDAARHAYTLACIALADDQPGAAELVDRAGADRDALDRRRDQLRVALDAARESDRIAADARAVADHNRRWQAAHIEAQLAHEHLVKRVLPAAIKFADAYQTALVHREKLMAALPNCPDRDGPLMTRDSLEVAMRHALAAAGCRWAMAWPWDEASRPKFTASVDGMLAIVRGWAAGSKQ